MKFSLNVAKSIYQNMPPRVKAPLEYVPFEVFCGRPYRLQREALRNFKQLDPGEALLERNRLLIKYLNDSISHTPFYCQWASQNGIKCFDHIDQYYDLPIIDKEMVQRNLSAFQDTRYENSRYKVSTGGSTGRQFSFHLDNECYSREWAFVADFLSEQGIEINSRRLCLRGVDSKHPDRLVEYNPLYKEMLISPLKLSEHGVAEHLEQMRNFGARWIHGYPSAVYEFAKILRSIGQSIVGIRGILLVSEKLYDFQADLIQEVFNCQPVSFYGLSERVAFAPAEHGGFTPHPLYGVCEVIDGELIATGFLNRATRLIRYRTGDAAISFGGEDRITNKLQEISGRWGKEYLIGRSGLKIYMTSLNTHSPVLERVRKFQFVQDVPGKCTIQIVPDKGFSESDGYRIHELFANKVGIELELSISLVSTIETTKRGKHSFIVRR
ncbi:hypothetical protein DSM14862_03526 (plasmid) [Sulfitobacter indolifex]|uniref:hypothetical protein n=1 Tax=Sulfitobacter indolifex TaxID=225422 RepID=UPI001FAD3BE0|nr:hypothetical protein [Sulfitobacter indolifex]UOA20688.1 hypothetical protein DSM14862_03526 [Sulfitobacter indolifex]